MENKGLTNPIFKFFSRYLRELIEFSLGQWFSAIINFIALPFISRLISPSEFGKGSMFLIASSLFYIFISLGTDQSYLRYFHRVSPDKLGELFWTCVCIPLCFFIILQPLLFFTSNKLSYLVTGESELKILVYLDLAVLTTLFREFLAARIRMKGKGLVFSINNVIVGILNVFISIIYAKYIAPGFLALVWGQIVSNIVSLAYLLTADRENLLPIKINIYIVKEILAYGFPLMISMLAFWLFTYLGRLLLRFYFTFEDIGAYSAAIRILGVLNLINASIQIYWIPKSFEIYEKRQERIKDFKNITQILSGVLGLISLLMIAFKDVIFKLLASEYKKGASFIPYLVLVFVAQGLGTVTERGINFKGKTYLFLLGYIAAIFVQVMLSIFLVPYFGPRAIAFAVGLASLVKFSISTYFSVKLYKVDYGLTVIFADIAILFIVSAVFLWNLSEVLKYFTIILGIILISFRIIGTYISLRRDQDFVLSKLFKKD
ncbi:MAG: lipopolysaccharide biosynthesis protein [Candidatus Hydrothermia bacterium]